MTQALLNGLIQGSLFAVVGVAFSIVFATTRTFYIALGAIYTVSPYVLLAAIRLHVPWALGVFLALSVAVILSIVCEESIHWILERKRAPAAVHLIASLGASLVIVQIAVLIWGNDAQVLRAGVDYAYEFVGGVRITRGQLIGLASSLLTLSAVFMWLRRAGTGLELRGLASNHALLSVLGSDVRGLRRIVFALSGALAALAAISTAVDAGFDPHVGMRAVLVGAAATIVGGRSSFAGAAIAGLLFGILRAQVVWYASARWEDVVTFSLLAVCLFLMPNGLGGVFSDRARLEEQP